MDSCDSSFGFVQYRDWDCGLNRELEDPSAIKGSPAALCEP